MCWSSLKKRKYIFETKIKPVLEALLAFCPLGLQVVSLYIKSGTGWKITDSVAQIILTAIWSIISIISLFIHLHFYVRQKRWAVINLENKLYDAAMNAQEKSHEAKMKSILQITYGNVPEWNPRNFDDNILLYDGHEHLRRILLDMRDAIREVLSTEERKVDAEAVSVDLIYCYPDNNQNGPLPAFPYVGAEGWRVIKSGNSSIVATANGEQANLRGFLDSDNSFYHSLSKKGYEFRNSKCRLAGKRKCCKCQPQDTSRKPDTSKEHDISKESDTSSSLTHTGSSSISRENSKPDDFVASLKDIEYNCIGSIVGQMLAIRNDQPSAVLLTAILTITTYGVKLCADDNGVKEKEFKEIFRSSFINPYKFLLESELTQLYIRHAIREQKMCKKTGMAIIKNVATPRERHCMLQDKCNGSTPQGCPFINEATASMEQNTSN